MIVSSGYNIAAPEVEEVLLTRAVVGTPDPDRGAAVTAFVVLRPGAASGPEVGHAPQEHAEAVAAPYKYPRRVRFLDALPRTAGGKPQRYLLRERRRG